MKKLKSEWMITGNIILFEIILNKPNKNPSVRRVGVDKILKCMVEKRRDVKNITKTPHCVFFKKSKRIPLK